MNRYLLAGAVVMLFVPVQTALPQLSKPSAPGAAVSSFYQFHLAHDMSFTRHNVLRRQRWLSPALYKLLLNEFVREKEYSRIHPNESFVPYMEGDPFTQSQEYPTSFRIGKSLVTGNQAVVKTVFLWDEKSSRGRDERNVQIDLVKENGKWLIDNIIDVDNRSNLLKDLKREKYLQ